MPKLKSNRGARKRFRVTAGGKIMRNRAYKSHILTKKNSKRKRRLGQKAPVSRNDRRGVRRMLLI